MKEWNSKHVRIRDVEVLGFIFIGKFDRLTHKISLQNTGAKSRPIFRLSQKQVIFANRQGSFY